MKKILMASMFALITCVSLSAQEVAVVSVPEQEVVTDSLSEQEVATVSIPEQETEPVSLLEQDVIWKDDFAGDKGWQTFRYKNLYRARYTKTGELSIKSNGIQCISKCQTNLNPALDCSIYVEAVSKSGLKKGSYFGIAFNCLDNKNYSLFCVEKGFAYFEQYRDGELVRSDYNLIKDGKTKIFNLEVKKKGTTAVFVINGEETMFVEQVEIQSCKIGLYVCGRTNVVYDNLRIKQ